MDAALVPRERRLFSTGEDPVATFISSTPEGDVQAPARAGKEKDRGPSGWHSMPFAPILPGPVPLVSWGIQGATLSFAFPEASAAGENSPRAQQRGSSLTREAAQGKTRPLPSKYLQPLPELLGQRVKGTSCPQVTWQGRLVMELMPTRGHCRSLSAVLFCFFLKKNCLLF